MGGWVWKQLVGAELAQAEKLLKDLVIEYLRTQKATKSGAVNPGGQGESSAAVITAPVMTEPIMPPTDVAQATTTDNDPHALLATSDLENIYDVADAETVSLQLPDRNSAPLTKHVGAGDVFKSAHVPVEFAGSKYPLRKSFATTTLEVMTNHYHIDWTEGTEFHVY